MQRNDRVPIPGGGTDRPYLFDSSIGKLGSSTRIRAVEINFVTIHAQLRAHASYEHVRSVSNLMIFFPPTFIPRNKTMKMAILVT
jgi:hypothetical protein